MKIFNKIIKERKEILITIVTLCLASIGAIGIYNGKPIYQQVVRPGGLDTIAGVSYEAKKLELMPSDSGDIRTFMILRNDTVFASITDTAKRKENTLVKRTNLKR